MAETQNSTKILEQTDRLRSVVERMETLRDLHAQYAAKVRRLEEFNLRLRSLMDGASAEDRNDLADHRSAYEALFNHERKAVRMALSEVSDATGNRIRLLRVWVAATIVFMSLLIGSLLIGMGD